MFNIRGQLYVANLGNIEVVGVTVLAGKIDLNSMSTEELWSLHEEISDILSAHILEEKRELEKRLAILNRGTNIPKKLTASRAEPKKRPRRKYPKVLPRYVNPDTSETWSGRGKRPLWLVGAMQAGHAKEEFLIR